MRTVSDGATLRNTEGEVRSFGSRRKTISTVKGLNLPNKMGKVVVRPVMTWEFMLSGWLSWPLVLTGGTYTVLDWIDFKDFLSKRRSSGKIGPEAFELYPSKCVKMVSVSK